MTEPFSSQTDFSCLGLCSSHSLSANSKNIPIIWNDYIIQATGPEPTSAPLQKRQLFLVKNSHIIHIDDSLHQLSFSMTRPLESSNICSNKATEQTHPSVHLGTRSEMTYLLIAHMPPRLSTLVWTNLAYTKRSQAWSTRRDKVFEVQSWAILLWSEMVQERPGSQQKLLENGTRLNFSCCNWKDQRRMLTLKKPGKKADRYLKHFE